MNISKTEGTDMISVIVPVYNVEKYIERCINSILNQTYTNFEILLIDDGSTDESGKICDRYALADGRIKVIHKTNGGLSEARNKGIDASKGKYITFVDSDDFLDKAYLEILYRLIKTGNYQISICNPRYYYEGQEATEWQGKEIIKSMCNIEALKIMLYQQYFDTSAWGKLFDRSLFASIRFPLGKLFEDMGTIYKTFLLSENVIFSNRELYFYLQRDTSISGQKYNNRKIDYLEFAEQIYKEIENKYPELKNAAASRCVSVSSHLMMQTYSQELSDIHRFFYSKICQYRKGLIFDKDVRNKNKIIIVLSYLGYNLFNAILKRIRSRNRRIIKKD